MIQGRTCLAVLAFMISLMSWGQTPTDSVPSIVEAIEASGVIFIEQPQGLANRLKSAVKVGELSAIATGNQSLDNGSSNEGNSSSGAGSVKTAGYRVQVFSDNNARTAKSEARNKAQSISARLPQYRTYVVYQSPFWRLKVGDFTTESEAEAAADEIKKLFPSYAREVRVVKDRINK